MNNKDMYWIKRSNGTWSHCTPLKMVLNPVLRFVQFYTKKPYVLASKVELVENSHPRFKSYTFVQW